MTRRPATYADLSHLDAIDMRLSIHRAALADAKTERQRIWSTSQIASIEKERVAELAFLDAEGIDLPEPMTIEEIMAELDEINTLLF